MRINGRHVIAPVDELPPGTRKFLTIDERPIAIFNIKGEFFGLLNRCPHQGAALCEGPLIGLAQSSDPGEIEYTQAGRNPALPLARLGIRHPHRAVLLRPQEIPHPRLSGQCRAGHQCGEGAVCRGDLGGVGGERLRGGGSLIVVPRRPHSGRTRNLEEFRVRRLRAAARRSISLRTTATISRPASPIGRTSIPASRCWRRARGTGPTATTGCPMKAA